MSHPLYFRPLKIKSFSSHALYHYWGTVLYQIYLFLCIKHVPSYKTRNDLMLDSHVLWTAEFNCDQRIINITRKPRAWDMPSVPGL
jgi:hypothetical protein